MTKPNIIFILVDDLGYGDLGCYGQKMIKTPHLDQMAQDGVRFTQHYAGNTVCAPSRGACSTPDRDNWAPKSIRLCTVPLPCVASSPTMMPRR